MKNKPIDALWDIHLFCKCPHCKEDVDLLDYQDFWDHRDSLNLGETRKGVEVVCPKCKEEFEVDCYY